MKCPRHHQKAVFLRMFLQIAKCAPDHHTRSNLAKIQSHRTYNSKCSLWMVLEALPESKQTTVVPVVYKIADQGMLAGRLI
ncbi:hypothetical protein COCSADRAFT_334930 [Bipolaris sorokiniana ND90Pr]|uniref:Uncharacterized protein n=1 Tax=Cochliobolus sativus (strain ND90Pr / ATCC 201652) TaxID=665912 RepID=M2R799_COCSN|nr:uncharacterized protein COCSADRAFT_334930 [Bipolaris sorokiniana ND90Pr]EMD62869.1 hypothetical protein COCSADRAFT_334930 [Bipolaris sorokiniana ND90Pr]